MLVTKKKIPRPVTVQPPPPPPLDEEGKEAGWEGEVDADLGEVDEIEEEMFSKPLKKMPIDKAEQAIDYQSI